MARLRVRIELNRGGVGVPLHKLVSVVDQARKFFHMLAEDVRIGPGGGEWLGFEFEHESLNFTAEYVGPVTPEQVASFNAAFGGTTSLRRGTIAQFARITEAIGEDELIGFGLYESENGAEPSEWRCLSRRDALRIADEIRLLAEVSGEREGESHLPAAGDSHAVARLFGDRHDRQAEQNKLIQVVREVETNLTTRIGRVEEKVEEHSGVIHDLRSKSAATEESFRNLLSAVEGFVDQAAHQFERISPPSLPAAPEGLRQKVARHWRAAASVAAVAVAVASSTLMLRSPHAAGPAAPAVVAASAPPATPASPASPAPVISEPAPAPPTRAPSPRAMRIDLEATEPTWVSLTRADCAKLFVGLLVPGDSRSFEVADAAALRAGNAGGLSVRLDGKAIGEIGPHGGVRQVEFANGAFKIASP